MKKKTIIALMMGLALMVPAYAKEKCDTPEITKEYILENNPNVEVVFELLKEGDGVIIYSSPDRDGNLVHRFIDGCRVAAEVVPFIPGV